MTGVVQVFVILSCAIFFQSFGVSWPAVRDASGAAQNDVVCGYLLQRMRVATYGGCCSVAPNVTIVAVPTAQDVFAVYFQPEPKSNTKPTPLAKRHDPPEQQRKQIFLPANASKAFILFFPSSGRFFVFSKHFRCYEESPSFRSISMFCFHLPRLPSYFTNGGKTQLFHT